MIEDADGNLLNATIAADGQWRFPYKWKCTQKIYRLHYHLFEDKRFLNIPVWILFPLAGHCKKYKNKEVVQGGSTITMQVIRLWKKDDKRSIWNKLKESILAVRLELSYSKRNTGLYASNAPFGSNVVGLDAAAWRYLEEVQIN